MDQEKQQILKKEIGRLIEAGVSGQVFPGACACISWYHEGERYSVTGYGGKILPQEKPVLTDTPYDLSSITKPVIAMLALRLAQLKILDIKSKISSIMGDVRGGPGGQATIEELFSHRSGLSPWGGFYLDVPHEPGSPAAKRWILNEASRRSEPMGQGRFIYSELGYMIAGEAVARSAGKPLDKVLSKYLLEPLGIKELYFAGALPIDRKTVLARKVAPTEFCEWRGKLLRGEVHDENCASLGGVAGHAGLFGTARAVSSFGMAMLDILAGRSDFISKELLEKALAPIDKDTHVFGWDRKSLHDSAAGKRLGPRTFGHLGFTGTSVWCDPDKDLCITLLSNRVYPSRANKKIKGFRPAFYDSIHAGWSKLQEVYLKQLALRPKPEVTAKDAELSSARQTPPNLMSSKDRISDPDLFKMPTQPIPIVDIHKNTKE